MTWVLMRDMDLGTVAEETFETLDEANQACIKANKAEDKRWKLGKKTQPDLPRAACHFYRVEKR